MGTIKRFGVILLALMLASVLLLAGCGSNGDVKETPAPATETDSPDQAATATPAKEELSEYTITVFVPGPPQKDIDLINAEASKYLKEKINAKLELTILDWGSWGDKMNLKIASNEAFDIIWSTSWDNYFSRIEKGAYLPLNDLMDKYAPDAVAALHPALLQGGIYNGKNYGFPVNKEIAAQRGVMLNKALVEKYKIDISTIKTVQDLEPLLEMIKKNEPEITPFLMNKDVNAVSIMNLNNFTGVTSGGAVVDATTPADDLKVFNIFADPRYKEELDLMRKWNLAGYINKDAATLQDFDGAVKAGNWFAFQQQLKPGKDAEQSNSHGVPMVQVPLTKPLISTDDVLGSMMSISSTSKDPDRAMMFINLLHTDKYLVNLISFGIEDKHYVKKSDNIIAFPEGMDPAASGYNAGMPYLYGNQFNDYLFENEDPNKWVNFENFNKEAVSSKILGFNINIESVKNEVTAYSNAYKEFAPGLLTGSVDPSEVLPKFLEKMKAIGVEKIYAEAQKQLDAWQASK